MNKTKIENLAAEDNGKVEETANNTTPKIDNADQEKHHRSDRVSLARFLADMLSAPYLVANTILTVVASLAVIGILISGGVGGNYERLLSGDPLALTLTLVTFTALLGGTMGLSLLADKREALKRDARLKDESDQTKKAHAQLMSSVKEVLQVQQEVSDTIGMVFTQSNATWYRRDNNSTSWSAIAAGTDLTSIDGFCLAEATATRNADGEVTFRANIETLASTWIPRFQDKTGLRTVRHMLGVKQEVNDPILTHAKLLKLMGVYRVLNDIAGQAGQQIDLSSVEIVLFDAGLWTFGPTFIGTKQSRASGQEHHPFVQRYTDITLSAGHVLNTGVEVSYSNELVSHYKSVVSELMGNAQRVLTLEDAERQFGRFVPKFVNGSNTPIVFQDCERKVEVIDHMDGSFSMGEYLC